MASKLAAEILPKLPAEILHLIISHIAPGESSELIHPKSDAFKSLLALMKVSRGFYFLTRYVFYKRCMYIDTASQARRLAACLKHSPPPFLKDIESPKPNTALQYIDTLYLSPSFLNRPPPYSNVIDSPAAVGAINTILCAVSPTLTRFICEMDLVWESGWESGRQGLTQNLRQAIYSLQNLRELVCLTRILADNSEDHSEKRGGYPDNLNTIWPELRRLALHEADLRDDYDKLGHEGIRNDKSRIWQRLASLKKLETCVLVGSEQLLGMGPDEDPRVDFVGKWHRGLTSVYQRGKAGDGQDQEAWRLARRDPLLALRLILWADFIRYPWSVATRPYPAWPEDLQGERCKGHKLRISRRLKLGEALRNDETFSEIESNDRRRTCGQNIMREAALAGTLFFTDDLEYVELETNVHRS